jgi:tetratricopeptide (TPR) repeat protein
MTGYPRSVAVTWQTSVAQLSDGGRRLLERLAWLAPEKVPESLLDVPVPGDEAENLRDAYDDLASYSLVTRDAEGPFFLVHRLVQDVTRRSLSGEARLRSLVEALQWISDASKGDARDIRTWPRLEPLAPHMREVATHADEHSIGQPTTNVMNQLAGLLYSKALHDQTEPLLRRALAIDEKSFGPDHPDVAVDLGNLAGLLRATDRLAEAEPLYRRALAIDEKSFGPDHPEVATVLYNLAGLLRATNRLAEAEPLMRRAVAIVVEFTRRTGHRHPHLDAVFNNYEGLLTDMGGTRKEIDAAYAELRRPLGDEPSS